MVFQDKIKGAEHIPRLEDIASAITSKTRANGLFRDK